MAIQNKNAATILQFCLLLMALNFEAQQFDSGDTSEHRELDEDSMKQIVFIGLLCQGLFIQYVTIQ